MKKILFMLIIFFPLASVSFAGKKDYYDKTTDVQKVAWMDKGMKAVKTKLKDSGSAQFRGVYFNKGSLGVPMTCGEVNSKNSYGGYSGFQRFISAGDPNLTFLEEQVSDFGNVWREACL